MMFYKFAFFVLLINLYQINGILPSEYDNILNICDDPKDQCPFHFHEQLPGMSISTYLGNRLMNIKKILDCGSVIWEADGSETRLSVLKVFRLHHLNKLAFVYSVTRFYHCTRYFEKRAYSWLEITHSLFEYKMKKLLIERYLDLSAFVDPRIFYVEEQHLYGLPSTVIVPYDKYEIVGVKYDYDTLWERQYGRAKCTCVIVHGSINKPKLIHMHVKYIESHEEIFFVYNEKGFKIVTKHYFYHLLNHLDKIQEEKQQEEHDSSEESD